MGISVGGGVTGSLLIMGIVAGIAYAWWKGKR